MPEGLTIRGTLGLLDVTFISLVGAPQISGDHRSTRNRQLSSKEGTILYYPANFCPLRRKITTNIIPQRRFNRDASVHGDGTRIIKLKNYFEITKQEVSITNRPINRASGRSRSTVLVEWPQSPGSTEPYADTAQVTPYSQHAHYSRFMFLYHPFWTYR